MTTDVLHSAVPSAKLYAAVFVAWGVFWLPILVGDEVVYVLDVLLFWLPTKQYWLERVGAGSLPLWWQNIGLGHPYLADASNQVFYPGNALLFFGDSPLRGITWFSTFHVLGGMCAVARLARVLGATVGGSVLGAVVFGLSGVAIGTTANLTYLPALVWVPLALSAAVDSSRYRCAAVAGGCLAMLLFAGDILNAALLVGAFGLFSWSQSCAQSHRWPWTVLAALLVGVGLSAVQWLPTVAIFSFTERADGLEQTLRWSFPPARVFEFIHPQFFGPSGLTERFPGAKWYPDAAAPWFASVYIGLIPMLLAGYALVTRLRGAVPLAIIGAVCLLISFGRWMPGAEAIAGMPFVETQRYPEKLIFWVTLVIAVMASLGFSALGQAVAASTRNPSRGVWALFGLAVVLIVLTHVPLQMLFDASRTASAYWSSRLLFDVGRASGIVLHAVVVAGAVAVAIVCSSRYPRPCRNALGGLAIANLYWIHAGQVPVLPHDALRPATLPAAATALTQLGYTGETAVIYDSDTEVRGLSPRWVGELSAELTTVHDIAHGAETVVRVAFARVLRDRLAPNWGAAYGVVQVGAGLSPLELVKRAPSPPGGIGAADAMGEISAQYVIDVLHPPSERWVTAQRDGRVYARHEDAARNFRLWEVASFAPRYAIELPRSTASADDWCPVYRQVCLTGAGVTLIEQGEEHRRLALVASDRPRVLRVAESFAPGWHLITDGGRVDAERSSLGLIRVAVPASDSSEVTLTYWPDGLTAGLWITAMTIAGLMVAGLRRSIGRRGVR